MNQDRISVDDIKNNSNGLHNWNKINEVCSYSPIEIILYYLTYPKQLFEDVYYKNGYISSENINNYISECYNSAMEYYNKKYKNKKKLF